MALKIKIMANFGNTMRIEDSKCEDMTMSFLEEHFFPQYTNNYVRYSDTKNQFAGIDCVFDYNEYKNKREKFISN